MTSEQRPVQVLLVNTWERGNSGDAVLVDAVLQQVREAFPGATIRIAGIEGPEDYPDFSGVENLGSTRRWMTDTSVSRGRRYVRRAAAIALVIAFGLPGARRFARRLAAQCPAEPRREIEAVLAADVVVSSAGGYFLGGPSLERTLLLAGLAFPLWVARAAKVPTVYAPQSFGPFTGLPQRGLMRLLLTAPDTQVLVREPISMGHLQQLQVRARAAVDPAFAYRSDVDVDLASLGVTPGRRLVLATARAWLEPAAQARYEAEFAAGLARILDADPEADVVLVAQVSCEVQTDDDRPVHARIAAAIDRPGRVHVFGDDLDHASVFAIYRHAHSVIGTRFHSVIFALTAEVPSIAIQYEHKTRGIMRDLGLERWVIDMADVTADRIIQLHSDLLAEHDDYREFLAATVPGFTAQAAAGVRHALEDTPGLSRRTAKGVGLESDHAVGATR